MSKFCKDCRYFIRDSYVAPYLACVHPENLSAPDLVLGKRTAAAAADMRKSANKCGPDAALFEERPPSGPVLAWFP